MNTFSSKPTEIDKDTELSFGNFLVNQTKNPNELSFIKQPIKVRVNVDLEHTVV